MCRNCETCINFDTNNPFYTICTCLKVSDDDFERYVKLDENIDNQCPGFVEVEE